MTKKCEAQFIDGSWYGDDCPDCRDSVDTARDDCENCQEDNYCPKHDNGIY